ncbi:MAG: hypothetical protein ACFB50_15670 [Rubrobacteraceae bacterium]
MIELYPCKRCGSERFEVVVKKHHELVVDDGGETAVIDAGGDSVGDVTCSTCGHPAATPDQLTEEEINYLLDGTRSEEVRT